MTVDQEMALKCFARVHGRNWKGKLMTMWSNGTDAVQPGGVFLRQLRNALGPVGLKKLRLGALNV